MKYKPWVAVMSVGIALLAMLGVVVNTGCEEASGTASLTVEPSFVDLTSGAVSSNSTSTTSSSGYTQTFVVTDDSLRDLSLPLTWSVSDPTLGEIRYAGGNSASYVRKDATGDNSILVEDQYGARGTATIRQ